ncbi:MAG: bacteriohemerythrin [Verrucomicrobiota bacterium]
MNVPKLNDLRLKTRLLLGFAIPALILMGIAAEVGIATSRVARQAERARVQGNASFDAAMKAQELKFHTVQVQQWLTDISATRGLDGLNDGFAKAEQHAKSFETIGREFEKAATNPKEQKQLAQIFSAFDAYYKEAIKMAKVYVAQGPEAGNKLMDPVDKAADALVALVDPFVAEHNLEGQESLSALAASVKSVRAVVWWSSSFSAILAIVAGLLISRSLARPINRVITQFQQTAQGDLTVDVPGDLVDRKDEIGEFASSAQRLIQMLRSVLGEVSESVRTLSEASADMSTISGHTAGGVRATSEKAGTVASAAEEMSTNSTSVAAGMDQAASSLTSVAAATEEMTSTIGEIATHSERARSMTADASQRAQNVAGRMDELTRAALAIGEVTESITTISDQTWLLALNATIEAARAGASGKGFAVVAHEIKELARQTAEATDDIKSKVDSIQSSTNATSQDFRSIKLVITEVSEIVNTIATAIEEQTSVTKDISRNVSQAASGVQDANQRVAQISTSSHSVAQEISAVNQAAGDIASGSEQVLTRASELSELAKTLEGLVQRFKLRGQDSASQRNERAATSSAEAASGNTPPDSSRGLKPFITWTDALSVGVPAMDLHHKKLVDLVNQLHAAMRSGKGRAAVGAALDELAEYVVYHFSAEEKLMESHRCPGLADQRAAHGKLLETVGQLRSQFASGRQGLGPEVLLMLQDWLVNHIQKKDKVCMASVCASRQGPAKFHARKERAETPA